MNPLDQTVTRVNEFAYDEQGNMLHDGRNSYQYDAFNRAVEAKTEDGKVQVNRYDAENLRYEVEENGKLVQFIFRDRDVAVEKSEDRLVRYVRDENVLLASDCESARTYYHYASDELGSITHVTDGKNEVVNRYVYDAFGNAVDCQEQIENRFRYCGQQWDLVTGQYYLRARYYNPVIARFTQEDTYRGDGLNLYAYCHNNPVGYWDPSGNMTKAECRKQQAEKNGNGRNSSGVVTGSGNGNVSRMMRGTQGNIGLIPQEVADKLRGRSFNNFGEFRSAFWKEIANSSYASEFSTSNITRMSKGLAPKVVKAQRYGKLSSYVLHHKTPIHAGGGVYNLDNLVIVTPRMHQEILDKTYHFGN